MKLTEHTKTVLMSVLWDTRKLRRKRKSPNDGTAAWRDERMRRKELETLGVRYDLAGWLGRPTAASDSAVFSRTLRNMEDLVLLVRVSRWGGRRTTHVRLTRRGTTMAKQLLRGRQAALDEALAGMQLIDLDEFDELGGPGEGTPPADGMEASDEQRS